MWVRLIAIFDGRLWQGIPGTEVGQLFKRRFVLAVRAVCSNATVFIFADSGALVKVQRSMRFVISAETKSTLDYSERESEIQIKLLQAALIKTKEPKCFCQAARSLFWCSEAYF